MMKKKMSFSQIFRSVSIGLSAFLASMITANTTIAQPLPTLSINDNLSPDKMIPHLDNVIRRILNFETAADTFKRTSESQPILYPAMQRSPTTPLAITIPSVGKPPVYVTIYKPERVTNDSNVPGYNGLENSLVTGTRGGGGQSCSNPGASENKEAEDFHKVFGDKIKSIGAIIRLSKLPQPGSELVGTGFLATDTQLITASHVLDEIEYTSPSDEFWVVFDLYASRFPEGISKKTDWRSEVGAVKIPLKPKIARVTSRDPNVDAGSIEIPSTGRQGLALAKTLPKTQPNIIVVSVPGPPSGIDAIDINRVNRNLQLCGFDKPSTLMQTGKNPVMLRLSVGKLVEQQSNSWFKFSADTLGGSSGAPIFDASTGLIIGIVSGTPEGHATWNVGTAIDVIIASTVAPVKPL